MAFKMKGSPMYRNFGVGSPASPVKGLLDLIPGFKLYKKFKEAKKIKNIIKSEWKKSRETDDNGNGEETTEHSETISSFGGRLFGADNPFSKT